MEALVQHHLLSLLIWLPLLAALVLFLVPAFSPKQDAHGERARTFSVVVGVGLFVLSLKLLAGFDSANPGYQFEENIAWIPSFGVSYRLGLDGISLWLVLLTTFLMPLIYIAAASIHERMRGYLACMFILQSAMIGTLVALDLFLFYVFWEMMLAPMYFIIGMWGGARRIYATLKFVLYTVFGSVLMLVAILFVVWHCYEQTGTITFDLTKLLENAYFPKHQELWLFAAFALAFGIKVPIFPFHTWLPDAHVEAPTGGSVVLAGVLLKLGLYGFIRFAYPLFPRAAEAFTPAIVVLAVIGIVYGALVAWAQTDIKKLVAYSSVSHLGYCVLGLAAMNVVATSGSVYQMLNHGISTGALFLLVGVLYDRRHTRAIADYGGIAAKVPLFAFLFLVFTFSSIALPLTNGFIGEFLILSGSFKSFPWQTGVAGLGVIFGAVYMLTLYMKVCFGRIDPAKNGELTDVNHRELATFLPLLILVFVMGLYPQPFLVRIEPAVNKFLFDYGARGTRSADHERSDDSRSGPGQNAQPGALTSTSGAQAVVPSSNSMEHSL